MGPGQFDKVLSTNALNEISRLPWLAVQCQGYYAHASIILTRVCDTEARIHVLEDPELYFYSMHHNRDNIPDPGVTRYSLLS